MRAKSDNFLLYLITFFVITMTTLYALLFYLFIPSVYDGKPQCSDTRYVSCDESTLHTTGQELKFNLRLDTGVADIQQVSLVEAGQRDYCDYEQLPSPQKVYHVICPQRDATSYTYQVDLEDSASTAGSLQLAETVPSEATDTLPAPDNVDTLIASDATLISVGSQLTFYSIQNPGRLLLQSILSSESYDVAYSENTMYVLTQDRLKIYDLKDPVSPFLLTDMSMRDAQNIQVNNNNLYVSALDRYFVFDVSNPAFPQRINEVERITQHIYAEDDTTYTVYNDTVTVSKQDSQSSFTMTPPEYMKERFLVYNKAFQVIPQDRRTRVGFPVEDIYYHDDIVYVAANYGNIQRYNYTSGEKLPQIVLPGDALNVAVHKDTLTSITTEGLISYKI